MSEINDQMGNLAETEDIDSMEDLTSFDKARAVSEFGNFDTQEAFCVPEEHVFRKTSVVTDFGDSDEHEEFCAPESHFSSVSDATELLCAETSFQHQAPAYSEQEAVHSNIPLASQSELVTNDKMLQQAIFAAKAIVESGSVFGRVDRNLYLYDAEIGAFRLFRHKKAHTESFQSYLLSKLPEELKWLALKPSVVTAVYNYLLCDNGFAVDLAHVDNSRFVCFRNGVFDLQTEALLPHSPDYGFKVALRCDYVEGKASFETKQFFWHLGKDKFGRQALFQMLGVALSNMRNLQLSGFLIGPPASGKSEFLRLFEHILPEESCTFVSLEDLGSRFTSGNIANTHVSVCGDLEVGVLGKKAQAFFKKSVGRDSVLLERKYEQPFSAKVETFMLFAGNALPLVDDLSGAFERRVWLINTGDTVPEEERNPGFGKILEADISAIASKAVRAAARVYRGEQINRADITAAYCGENASIERRLQNWLKQNLVEDDAEFVRLDDLKEVIANTGLEEIKKISMASFGKLIRKCFPLGRFAKRQNVAVLLDYTLGESALSY